jgi:aspartyl-tRNA synthetase
VLNCSNLKKLSFFTWKLLEECDTLQLRLSNALRVNEELRARNRTLAVSSPDTTTEQLQSREQMPQNIEAAVSLPPSVSTTVQEPQEDLQSLSNK